MPEQLDPQVPAGAVPEAQPVGVSAGAGAADLGRVGSRPGPFEAAAEVLEVSPLHKEVIGDLRWAYEQCARGAFDAYAGQYLAIVNRAVFAAGGDLARMIEEAARQAGVPPERVALFHIEVPE